MNKKLLLGIGIIVAVVVLAVALGNKHSDDTMTTENTTVTQTPVTSAPSETVNPSSSGTSTPTSTAKTFTLAQVATHNSEPDCYSAINGKVYDLTAWIHQHPGGDRAILSICGKDGSAAFNDQHGGQSRPENILSGFEIGILVN